MYISVGTGIGQYTPWLDKLGVHPPLQQRLRFLLPMASGDFAAFLIQELLESIPDVSGSGANANPDHQHNQYVLPTASQLASWRAVFASLLAGAWGPAHGLARMISSTYNVVQFIDTPTGLTYYVLMEGVPGKIPAPANHPSGVPITDPTNPTRRGWGTYVFAAQPQRALSISAPHPHDDLKTELQAVEAFLAMQAHTLLIAGADRDQNTAEARCAQSNRPYLEADVSHTAESVFQIAFEEIYSSDASTWHLQFHGNASPAPACRNVDVFLSNGVKAAPAMLYTLSANITTASQAAAAGGPVLRIDVYDGPGDCALRGTNNMQLRFASGRPHTSICPKANGPLWPSRFIHIEQRLSARRAPNDDGATPGRNRSVVLAGIFQTFRGWRAEIHRDGGATNSRWLLGSSALKRPPAHRRNRMPHGHGGAAEADGAERNPPSA